jgi:Polyketide cyclase / dehydrase and lipid transport
VAHTQSRTYLGTRYQWLGHIRRDGSISTPQSGMAHRPGRRGHVRRNGRGPVYWTIWTVIASDPGREFAFTVAGPGGKTINTWRYQLDPDPEGTDVTESFELSDTLLTRLYWTLAGRARRRTNLSGMRATLEKIRAVAESADSSG